MSRPDDPDKSMRDRSLLTIGDRLRAPEEKAASEPSRLAKALSEARARRGLQPVSVETRGAAPSQTDAVAAPSERAPGIAPEVRTPPPEAHVGANAPSGEPRTAWSGFAARALAAVKARASKRGEPEHGDAAAGETAIADDEAMDDGRWRPIVDPGSVIRGIANSKKIVFATAVAGAVLGATVAITTPKRYHAAAELLADPRDLNIVDRELTQPGTSSEAILALVENQVRIMTSGSVLTEVVERLRLDRDPEFNGQGSSGLFSTVKAVLFGSGPPDARKASSLAVTNLAEKLSVQRGGRTFVIVVAAETQSADKSALVANTVTDVFLETFGRIRSDAVGRAANELTSKLDELRNSLEAAERKVETFKAENDIIDAQGRLISDDEIVKLNDQLSTARARTLELNARAESVRSVDLDTVLGGSLPEAMASPSIQELRAQYATLKGEVDRLAARLGPRHPQLIAVQAQMGGARDLLEAEIRRIVSAAQTDLKRAVQLEQELSSRLAQLKVRQGSLSGELVTLRELERDATAKRAVYEAFLLRARETGEQQGINSANISIISQAQPPLEAEPPSRTVITLAGLLFGILAGIGIGGARGTMASLRSTLGARRRRTLLRAARPETVAATNMFDDRPSPPTVDRETAVQTETEMSKERQDTMYDPHNPEHVAYLAAKARDSARPPGVHAAPPGYGASPQPLGPTPAHPYSGFFYGLPQAARASAAQAPAYRSANPQGAMPAPDAGIPHAGQMQTAAQIEEIRASLRECREAIRELTEQRTRHRYF